MQRIHSVDQLGILRILDMLKGVKQGDTMAPFLFCIVMTRRSETGKEGWIKSACSGGKQILSNLRFSDVIAVTDSIIAKLKRLVIHSPKLQNNINNIKTEWITAASDETHMNTSEKNIKYVSGFIYLRHKSLNIKENSWASGSCGDEHYSVTP